MRMRMTMHGMHRRGSVLARQCSGDAWRGSVLAGECSSVHAILLLGVTRWVKPGSRSRLGPRATLAPREPRIRYYRGFSLLPHGVGAARHPRPAWPGGGPPQGAPESRGGGGGPPRTLQISSPLHAPPVPVPSHVYPTCVDREGLGG